jgi:multicomponent Na+:H+ antiporter subunit B
MGSSGHDRDVSDTVLEVDDMLEINLILLFMIAASVIAVEAKDLLSSVIAVGAVGIGLCMAFLVLKAPDLAIMQLVVEILSLIILIRATNDRDLPFSASGRWRFNTFVTVSFVAVFLSLAYAALKDLPAFGSSRMNVSKVYIDNAIAATGSKNVVASIIVNFRAYDTLGEAAILFTALIGILAISRKIGKNN